MSSLSSKCPKGQHSSEIHQDPELKKVLLSQLSILIITSKEDNWISNRTQIRSILQNYRSIEIKNYYLQKLIGLCLDSDLREGKLSYVELLLKEELQLIAKDLSDFEVLCTKLKQLQKTSDLNIIKFVERFDCDIILAFALVINFQNLNHVSTKTYVQRNSIKLLSSLKERNFPTTFNWTVVLDLILNTPFFPLINKLLTLSSIKVLDTGIEPIVRFHQSILKMSFKQLLIEIGPEHLLPEKLLGSFLRIKPAQIEDSIALILSEILIPGSQALSGTEGRPTGLTSASNLPESSSKGAQILSCLKSVDADPKLTLNWQNVFVIMKQYLSKEELANASPTLESINQFLSCLDFKQGLIDMFLSQDWWFSKTLFYLLQNLDPAQGAFNIFNSNNLELCYSEDEISDGSSQARDSNPSRNLLQFIAFGKLELGILAIISKQGQAQQSGSEQDKNLDIYMTQVFERDYRLYPEYLLAAALNIKDKSTFVVDLVDTLFTLLMDSNSASLKNVIFKLKAFDPQFAVSKFIDYYSKRNTTEAISRLVQIALQVDLLDALLDKLWSLNLKIGLAFTIEAGNHGYNIKSVLEAKFRDKQQKDVLAQTLVEVLALRASQDEERSQKGSLQRGSFKLMRIPVLFYLLDKLKGSNGAIDPNRFKNLQVQLLTVYPRLINFGCGHDAAILVNGENYNLFSPDVEQEMKSYYSKMYNKELDIKDIVDMLSRMKNSDDSHDQDVFACMIHSLIDEYRFFPEYPLTALASTSLLFGALLQKDLIQGTALTVALNFIWESCNQPQDSHLFKFAIQSLYNFKSRLHEYPNYCKHLLECQTLSAHAKMYRIVEDAANGIACPEIASNNQSMSNIRDLNKGNEGLRYESINVTDNVLDSIIQEVPPESVSDKFLFFINNMTADNLSSKFAEIKPLMSQNFYSWFANYLVKERAKTEPNNHRLYASFVQIFDDSLFYKFVVYFSICEAERIIRNFKDSSTDRNNLKNIGAWLGMITLAMDLPLKRNQIALKYLLIEAYGYQTLGLIIPFVCKILDQAKYSNVFKLPNPWVLGILEVLSELYVSAELKLNLKFEIEVLLNSLQSKIEDITPSTLVRQYKSNPDSLASTFGNLVDPHFLSKKMSHLKVDGEPYSGKFGNQYQQPQVQQNMPVQHHQQQIPNSSQPTRSAEEAASRTLDTSFSKLVGNTIFTQNVNLRRAFQASLSRAVRECAVPILTRVSEAVLTTTEVLIKKDFACEGDVNKFVSSYKRLAQQLSHSMVLCSGRKLLSETIESNMIQFLGNQINPNDLPFPELTLAIQQNVNLCVDIVDQIASGNIGELVDERMRKYVLARERHNTREPYVKEDASDYAKSLPAPLGLQTEGLSSIQLAIYENFGLKDTSVSSDVNENLNVANNNSALGVKDGSAISNINVSVSSSSTPQQHLSSLQQDEAVPSVDQLLGFITQSCETAIKYSLQVKEVRLEDLPNENPIMVALVQALTLTQSNALKYPDLVLRAAQYAVNCLFTQMHSNPLTQEIYVIFLDKLCEYSPSTAKDVTWWLIHSSDQRKFNVPVIFALLKIQLLDPIKFDISLSKLLTGNASPIVFKFAVSLLYRIYTSDDFCPAALRSEFAMTLDVIQTVKVTDESHEAEEISQMKKHLFDVLEKNTYPTIRDDEPKNLYSQMGYVFAEWTKLVAHGPCASGLLDKFIQQLLDSGILTEIEFFESFFTAATKSSVMIFSAEHEIRERTQHESYLTVDAVAKLIVRIMLKFDEDHLSEAIQYLKNIFNIIFVSLTNDHEASKGNWNERAYFRIFSSILCEWNDSFTTGTSSKTQLDEQFYIYFSDAFSALQPIIYPGFTFAWISLIGHRMFMPRMLELPNKKGYPGMIKLLSALLKFEKVYLKDEYTSQDVLNVIFKAINRLFVGIYHDYPEFLISCHYPLVCNIPDEFTQLKNIVLSATPRNLQSIDPFSSVTVEKYPELKHAPEYEFSPAEDLTKFGLKKPVDNYLRISSPALVRTIITSLKSKDSLDDEHYNLKLMNALVFYSGIHAVNDLSNISAVFNPKSTSVSLLIDVIQQGDTEFKFHLLNSIVNQLRYPNSHTNWFIHLILYLFGTETIWSNTETRDSVQELVIRILLERHTVQKPHPWGATVAFNELIKNSDIDLFKTSFVVNAPSEIKVVFDSLSRCFNGSSSNLQTASV